MYVVKSKLSTILVDIGVSFKSALASLEALGISLSEIDALFITHEHIDHIKGLPIFLNKTNIPVYMTRGTKKYIENKYLDKITNFNNIFEVYPENMIEVKDVKVTPFTVSHDAKEPVGYNLACMNSSLTIATDLGFVSENVFKYLSASNFSVIESNYDKNLLLYGNYSYPLKCRIQSDIRSSFK